MIRLRHLLAQRLTHPAAASLLLLVVAFRLLLPPGLMLAPSTGERGVDLSICSGHGALFGDAPATCAHSARHSRSASPRPCRCRRIGCGWRPAPAGRFRPMRRPLPRATFMARSAHARHLSSRAIKPIVRITNVFPRSRVLSLA
ncbi:hypothetical protein AB4851_25180 [Burkholderia sp. 22PA0099]|uniref:hypothetical protein n=1 Tax=Burkholderia sp. 22PA0099 TaxID=3237372 RepID=UPI0039C1169A